VKQHSRFNLSLHYFLISFVLLALASCQKRESASSSALRISIEQDPSTLDPRRAQDLGTASIIHMLYEGLMRSEKEGQHSPGIAEEVIVSPDQKTYTFKLRPAKWSNGDPLTAHDFEQTWKSTLDPKFPSPNAYQLFVLKGGRAAKEGKGTTDEIGVHAVDDSTLVITLAQPTPYFLNLITTHFYYPVHASMRKETADSTTLPDSKIVTNGPFKLDRWQLHSEFIANRNPQYWDSKRVALEKIHLMILDNPTALQLFKRGELDWTGSPLSTLSVESLSRLKEDGELETKPAAGIYLVRINTGQPPFHRTKMRRAFALALNRQDLVDRVLQGNQIPACGMIPPSFIEGKPLFKDCDIKLAKQLFDEALKEQGLTWKNFPLVTIHYAANERAHKIAQVAQQQWKNNLGIDVNIQSVEPKIYFEKIKNHDYQLGIGSWFADIHDPIAFLDLFKSKYNGTNNTQWEHSKFMVLLNQSSLPEHFSRRKQLIKNAENILIREMPVIPLFFSSYNYVKNPNFKGFFFSELGYIDFKNSYWD